MNVKIQQNRIRLVTRPGGEQWKKKLIPAPNTYEGSFAEADMNKFRPVPAPNPAEDPWYVISSVVTSNLHETTLRSFEKISFKVY